MHTGARTHAAAHTGGLNGRERANVFGVRAGSRARVWRGLNSHTAPAPFISVCDLKGLILLKGLQCHLLNVDMTSRPPPAVLHADVLCVLFPGRHSQHTRELFCRGAFVPESPPFPHSSCSSTDL